MVKSEHPEPQKKKNFWHSLTGTNQSRVFALLSVLVILAVIPLTVFLAQHQQSLQQHAAGTAGSPGGSAAIPACPDTANPNNPVKLFMNPSNPKVGDTVTFTVTNSDPTISPSTNVDDIFTSGLFTNCDFQAQGFRGFYPTAKCVAAGVGSGAWSHEWQNCIGNSNNCGPICIAQAPIAVAAGPANTPIPGGGGGPAPTSAGGGVSCGPLKADVTRPDGIFQPPQAPGATDSPYWQASCSTPCNSQADCKPNDFDPSNINPGTSNYCYTGFSGGNKCMMLVRTGCTSPNDPGCLPPTPVPPPACNNSAVTLSVDNPVPNVGDTVNFTVDNIADKAQGATWVDDSSLLKNFNCAFTDGFFPRAKCSAKLETGSNPKIPGSMTWVHNWVTTSPNNPYVYDKANVCSASKSITIYGSGAPNCDAGQVLLTLKNGSLKPGGTAVFTVGNTDAGDPSQGSTYISDSWVVGSDTTTVDKPGQYINCGNGYKTLGNWPYDISCTFAANAPVGATNVYTWIHRWQTCAHDNCAIKSSSVCTSTPYTFVLDAAGGALTNPTITPTPSPTVTLEKNIITPTVAAGVPTIPPTDTPTPTETPQPTYTPTPAPTCENTDLGCIPNTPILFVQGIYGIGLGLVGGIGILFFIFGGYIILASQGHPATIAKGKSYIYYAIVAVLLAVFGYVFVQTIIVDVLHIPGFE